ncbi:MAG: helix-turn-helix domain-containing protein [Erysipelotrichaceae bacterium]|nr:helix-turn-helix domain-containing protein [Erysipelotrichaceae bacterium]
MKITKQRKIDIGSRIAGARKDCLKTQAEVAENLDVTFQAVSLWERGESLPDTENLINLADLLEVSVSALVEDRGPYVFETHDKIFDWEHMVTFVKHTAKAYGMRNTTKALPFAIKAHEGQYRKKSNIPYIYHPLNLACHCFALDIRDDAIVAACLLHDTVEDCGCTYADLPVDDETKELVRLMTHEKDDDKRDKILRDYYKGLASNPKAAFIKCLDRCNNLTTMSWGLNRGRIYWYIRETEKYIPALLKVIKNEPEFNNAAWLLQYQIESMLDIYKRLM